MKVLRRPPRDPASPRSLVVLLHGLGADGADLFPLAEDWAGAAPGAVFLAPDAPDAYAESSLGRQWFALQDRRPAVMAAAAAAAAPALDAWLDAALAREGAPPGRLAIMGFSQGAMMALQVGLRRRPAPAALLAFSGALLDPGGLAAPRDRWPALLLVHGEADPIVPVAASRMADTALRALGAPVESLFPHSLGHGIDPTGIAAAAAVLRRVLV